MSKSEIIKNLKLKNPNISKPVLESVFEDFCNCMENSLLEKKNIVVTRSLVGNYTTSLEMAGASFTITKLDENIVNHWDSPVHTSSLRWKI